MSGAIIRLVADVGRAACGLADDADMGGCSAEMWRTLAHEAKREHDELRRAIATAESERDTALRRAAELEAELRDEREMCEQEYAAKRAIDADRCAALDRAEKAESRAARAEAQLAHHVMERDHWYAAHAASEKRRGELEAENARLVEVRSTYMALLGGSRSDHDMVEERLVALEAAARKVVESREPERPPAVVSDVLDDAIDTLRSVLSERDGE
jgi:hypothetical protein